jgi:hypothetical protein
VRCLRANVPGGGEGTQAAEGGSAAWMLARSCLLSAKACSARKIRSNEDPPLHSALAACMGSQLMNHRNGMGHQGHRAHPL